MKTVRILALAVAIGVAAASSALAQNPYAPNAPGGKVQSPWLNGSGANPYSPFQNNIVPYMPVPMGGGYNPYSPWAYGGYGGGSALMGQAQLLQAYGSVIINQEQGRILREQAMQAKIDTARRRFDFELYYRANSPTLADEYKRIARNTLNRIRVTSNPTEIATGKALNILLDDIRSFPLKKASMDSYPLSEDVLKQLNVTSKTLGVGLLRHDGKFNWPLALLEIIPADQRKAVETQVEIAVKKAAEGKIEALVLADIDLRMKDIRKTFNEKLVDLSQDRARDADQFLSDFRDARQAISEGTMAVQDKFNRFIVGGKTMQEVADYMVSNGLRFAPSTPNDQGGYLAIHTALVTFDVALNREPPPSEGDKQ